MKNPEVVSPTFERTPPPRSRGYRSAAAVALGLFLAGGGIAVAVDSSVKDNCAKEDTAFSFNLSEDHCDGYETNVTSRIDGIVDAVTPNISIVDLPIFDVDSNDFKIFSQER